MVAEKNGFLRGAASFSLAQAANTLKWRGSVGALERTERCARHVLAHYMQGSPYKFPLLGGAQPPLGSSLA